MLHSRRSLPLSSFLLRPPFPSSLTHSAAAAAVLDSPLPPSLPSPRRFSPHRVAHTLRILRRDPSIALTFFTDCRNLGFRPDPASLSLLVSILSHPSHRSLLLSLFSSLLPLPFPLPLLFHRLPLASLPPALDSLIKAQILLHRPAEAINAFQQLGHLGYIPTARTCNFLLNSLVKSDTDLAVIVEIYNQIKNFGVKPNVYIFAIMINAYCRGRDYERAVRVLDEMAEAGVGPDLVAITTLIQGLCNGGKADSGFSILDGIMEGGFEVDVTSLNVVIRGLCVEMKLVKAETLLERMKRYDSSLFPDVYTYGPLIRSNCATGNILRALDLYDEMQARGIGMNSMIVTFVLHGFCKLGMDKEALDFFHQFKAAGLRLDKVLYNIGISANCKLGYMRDAVELFREMEEKGLAPDTLHYTTLIHGYCRKNEMYNARKVFDEMIDSNVEPDLVTYNLIAGGFCRNGFVKEAFELLDYMMARGTEPNAVTYSIAIENLCKAGKLEDAVQLFKIFEERGDAQCVLFSSMVHGYLENGRDKDRTKEAYKLFIRFCNRGVLVDEVARTHLVSALCWINDLGRASTVCKWMLKMSVTPDLVTYTKLIAAYCQQKDMEQAQYWFNDLFRRGVSPDAVLLTTMIKGYYNVHCFREASMLCKTMMNSGLKLDVIAHTTMLVCQLKGIFHEGYYDRAKEDNRNQIREKYTRLLNSMKSTEINPDVVYYTTSMAAYCKARCVEDAFELFREMPRKGLTPDEFCYTTLIVGYCKVGNLEGARKIFNEMIEKGMTPTDEFAVRTLVSEYHRQGGVEEAEEFVKELITIGMLPASSSEV